MKKKNLHIVEMLMTFLGIVILISCSSTSAIPDGEQLFTGLKPIQYTNYEKNPHATTTQEEMEYVLASAPNGALFGSSYYRTPFPVRLWVWNAFSPDSTKLSQWITKTFGSQPKLMGNVNPNLRTLVAENQLKKYGYFHGNVDYKIVNQTNPKKAKVAYTVDMGHLWRIDSISYLGFLPTPDSLLTAHKEEAKVKKDDPFMVSSLDQERQRISSLLKNNGYYYYESGNASYLADTINVPGKVQLRFMLSDSLSPRVQRQWYVGNMYINFRKQMMQALTDSVRFRHLTLRFSGRRPPVRLGAVMHDVKIRTGQLYSDENEKLTKQNLQSTGLFSYTNLQFTPRDSSLSCDTIDATLDLVFDKPYDFYVEANAKGKTTGRMGPELVLGFVKRNAFHGGEKLDINMHGSYEWMTGHDSENSQSGVNSYEYGADASLVFPRILTLQSLFRRQWKKPEDNKHRPNYTKFFGTPTTTLKASLNVLNRASYFKRHVVSGELTYDWWTSERSHHSFSPLVLSYEYMQNKTASFDSLLAKTPYLQISMRDQFVPKMSYTYSYTSSSTMRNPITWETTVSEAGNILATGYTLCGENWKEKNKKMFKNPFAQFVKIETDFVKVWHLSERTTLVGHLNSGAIWSYGNAEQAPYYEQFYIGGANSVRAFNIRSIGPGKYVPGNGRYSYIDETGDIKFLANLEYRPHLFGDLYGALFLDAGNVWSMKDDTNRPGGKFGADFMKQMALGTGVGVRYDMGMFVIRVDWGVGLHMPYETNKAGFYNITSFKDAQSIHLAVGYPF